MEWDAALYYTMSQPPAAQKDKRKAEGEPEILSKDYKKPRTLKQMTFGDLSKEKTKNRQLLEEILEKLKNQEIQINRILITLAYADSDS